jgi:hypothetical protein
LRRKARKNHDAVTVNRTVPISSIRATMSFLGMMAFAVVVKTVYRIEAKNMLA